jgi:hypothetical protein
VLRARFPAADVGQRKSAFWVSSAFGADKQWVKFRPIGCGIHFGQVEEMLTYQLHGKMEGEKQKRVAENNLQLFDFE